MSYFQGMFDARSISSIMFMTDQKEPDERGYRKVNRIVIDNLTVDVFGGANGNIILPNDIIVNSEINSIIHLASPYSRIDFIDGKHEYFSIESGTEKVDAQVYFLNLIQTQIRQHFHRIYYRINKEDCIKPTDLPRELGNDRMVVETLLLELSADIYTISKFINVEEEVNKLKGN